MDCNTAAASLSGPAGIVLRLMCEAPPDLQTRLGRMGITAGHGGFHRCTMFCVMAESLKT